ncbi:MAG TPA: 3-deoxy-7-phosphoheptulonate synthase, partial [Acidimicrobiia bacterium]|nr:3-deoxy-7-phosphoheptulonate synthase [Acidimicrobiia bacterium]
MIVVLEQGCSLADKARVVRFIEQAGGRLLVSELGEETHIGLVDDAAQRLADRIRQMRGVAEIREEAPPYPQVAGGGHTTEIRVGEVRIGGKEVVVAAGPCAVEGPDQLSEVARGVAAAGAVMLRGGAFKPRTSPYSFQG